MKYIQLTGTELQISQVALGTWVFGGHFWNGANENDCVAAVHAAIEAGINLIDTAPDVFGW